MSRIGKIIAWMAGTLAVLLVCAVGGFYLFVTSDDFRSRAEGYASDYTGRKTKIGGIAIEWGETTHVRLENVQVANPDWAEEEHMLKVVEVDLAIRLWPLLMGDLVLPHLVLRRPEVAVERDDEGRFNWSFGVSPVARGTAEAVTPDERFEAPLVRLLEITEGRASYRDPRRKIELDGTISTASGEAGEQPQVRLVLDGSLEGKPLKLRFTGGSALLLRETDHPYPVGLDVEHGATRLQVEGTLQDPFQWKGANVGLTLAGASLSDIYPLLGIPGPPTPSYRIAGRLDREGGLWKLTDSKWRVGDTDLAGDVVMDRRKKPRHLAANLVSRKLAIKDLAPLAGARLAGKGQLEATGDLFPDAPLKVERLRVMNMDVTLDAKRVVAPDYLPVQALSFRVVVEGGNATVKPLTMSVIGGGTLAGELGIDARADTPRLRTDLKLANVELKSFFRNSEFFNATQGRAQGRVQLAGQGRSLAQVMSVADGHIAVALGGGSISSLMVSLAGLQLFDALVLYVTGDKRIPILCAVGRMNFQKGIVTFDHTFLDTQKSVLEVRGQAGLGNQMVNAEVKAYPKSFDLLDLHGPVHVRGKLRQPSIKIGRVIPIPTPIFGTAKDLPCQALTAQLLSGR
jgi:AsmA family protein